MIRTLTYSLEQGEAGFVLSFSVPPSAVKPKDQYIISLDVPVTLPENPPTTVLFEPSNGSYVVFGNRNLSPKVFVKIKSLHRAETKTLIRLTIKDVLNTILYRDYVMVMCIPETVVELNATLLPSNTNLNIGPNGGSIVRLSPAQNVNTSQLDVGMVVRGPGIPNTGSVYYIISIISATDIELDRLVPSATGSSGKFQFIRQTGCVDPNTLVKRSIISPYTVLDLSNNWTYTANSKLIVRFVPFDIGQNVDTVILLPIKNPSLLSSSADPSPIPDISLIKIGGRVINNSVCASEATS